VYNWLLNGTNYINVTGVSTLNAEHLGQYQVLANDSLVPGLTLYSTTVNITHLPVNKYDSLALVNLYDSAGGQHWNALDLSNNGLTYAGMENIARSFDFAVYYPQDSIPLQSSNGQLSASVPTWGHPHSSQLKTASTK
jgi:hypothetical protein